LGTGIGRASGDYGAELARTCRSWDREYKDGAWAYLWSDEQRAHYVLLADMIARLAPVSSLLDVGCGEGVLASYLEEGMVGQYVGIDGSAVAIEGAKARYAGRKTLQFLNTTVADYLPIAPHNEVAVFNEVLYYLDSPVRVVDQTAARLTGRKIVLISVTGFEPECWNEIVKAFGGQMFERLRLQNEAVGKSWNVGAIRW
jgi:SAM-dependent methyltransferase